MGIWVCDFCKRPYDSNSTPKVKGVCGGLGKYICEFCLKKATTICKEELGSNWPKKKEE